MRVRKNMYVARPPDEVFWFVAENLADRRWRTELLRGETVGEVTQGVGAHLRQSLSYQGRIVQVNAEVTEFVPGSRIGFRVHGGARSHGCVEFKSEGPGTRAHFTLTVELKGTAAMMERYVSQAIERVAEADLKRLKSVLEGRDDA